VKGPNGMQEQHVEFEASKATASGPEDPDLGCLDHTYFLAEVNRVLGSAEQQHRKLFLESRNSKLKSIGEQNRLEVMESVICQLRNQKRLLQSMLQYDPVEVLQHLYNIQDTMNSVWNMDVSQSTTTSTVARRYSANDAWDADLSDDEDVIEDMSNLSVKGKHRQKGKGNGPNKQPKSNKSRR